MASEGILKYYAKMRRQKRQGGGGRSGKCRKLPNVVQYKTLEKMDFIRVRMILALGYWVP